MPFVSYLYGMLEYSFLAAFLCLMCQSHAFFAGHNGNGTIALSYAYKCTDLLKRRRREGKEYKMILTREK